MGTPGLFPLGAWTWSPWEGKSRKHPSNVSQGSLRARLVGAPDFTDRETEAQGGRVTCPKLPGDFLAIPGLLALTPESMGTLPLTPEAIQPTSAPASGRTREVGTRARVLHRSASGWVHPDETQSLRFLVRKEGRSSVRGVRLWKCSWAASFPPPASRAAVGDEAAGF